MKIGIDLGGTKTEAILINNQGIELFRKRIVSSIIILYFINYLLHYFV